MTDAVVSKQKYRAFLLALRADILDFPGGFREVGRLLGRNSSTLSNQVNPDHGNAMLSLPLFLEIMTLVKGQRSMAAMAGLVDMTVAPMVCDHLPQALAVQQFMGFVKEVSDLVSEGSGFAEDLRFDSGERQRLLSKLIDLQGSIFGMTACLRGD